MLYIYWCTCIGVRHTGAWWGREWPWALGVRHLWWLAGAGAQDCCEEILYILTLQLCKSGWHQSALCGITAFRLGITVGKISTVQHQKWFPHLCHWYVVVNCWSFLLIKFQTDYSMTIWDYMRKGCWKAWIFNNTWLMDFCCRYN